MSLRSAFFEHDGRMDQQFSHCYGPLLFAISSFFKRMNDRIVPFSWLSDRCGPCAETGVAMSTQSRFPEYLEDQRAFFDELITEDWADLRLAGMGFRSATRYPAAFRCCSTCDDPGYWLRLRLPRPRNGNI